MRGSLGKTEPIRNVVALSVFHGRLWAGCYGEGLFFWDGSQWRRQPKCPRYITGLAADRERLWFCTWMEGEIGFVGQEGKPPVKIPLPRLVEPRYAYRCLHIAVAGRQVWVSTVLYLLRLDAGDKEIGPDWELLILHDGGIIVPSGVDAWVGSPNGLWQYKDNLYGFCFRPVRRDIEIASMTPEPSGKALWLGTLEGTVERYETESGWRRTVFSVPLPKKAWINALALWENRVYVAVGSPGFSASPSSSVKGGVGVYEATHQRWKWLEKVTIRDAKSLCIFDGRLWVGGVEGVQSVTL